MSDIRKTIPNELIGNSKYSVRVRSINPFGVGSEWSDALVVDTSASSVDTARRLIITEDGMIAYDIYGQMVFGYYGDMGNRINHIQNPSFEIATTGWGPIGAGTLTRDLTKYLYGQPGYLASAKITCSAAGSTGVGMEQQVTHRTTVTAGEIVTVSCYVNPAVLNKFQVGLRFYNGSGALVQELWSPSEVNAGALAWTRISSVGTTVPTGAVKVGAALRSTKAMGLNETYNVDGFLLEKTSILREYFDGSTSAGNTSWSGNAHESESLLVVNNAYYENGSVITESTIQTNPYPEIVGGVKLDPSGLKGYNTLGVMKVEISADTGDITATDGIFTGSTFQTSLNVGTGSPNAVGGVVFNDSGIKGYSGVGTTPSFFVSTDGTMTALAGNIGGWTINSTNLSNSNVTLGSSGTITVGTGNEVAKLSSNHPSNYRLWIGHDDPLLAPFRVLRDGTFVAEGAMITGTISAEVGEVGGWTVGATTLVGGNVTLDSSGVIRVGTGNNVAVMSGADATYRIWAGHALPATAPFRVSQTGDMISNSGTLAGINVSPNQLSVGSGANRAGMRAATTPASVVFYAGNEDWDLAPYRVYNDGTVVAEFVLTPTVDGSFIWHAGNDGSGSGLDADLLDGQHGSFYRNATNLDSGTVNTARIAGSYTGITAVGTLGSLAVTGTANFTTTPTVGANTIWHMGNDGAGSTLDADLLDGQHGAYYREWGNILSKPDPTVTVELTGPVQGTANQVWTDLNGNINISIATSIPGGPGSNINADLLDGLNSTYFLDAANMNAGILPAARLSGSYTISITGNVTGNVTGNASTATALQTTRTIAGFNFNGTQNVTLATHTRGTYLTGADYNGSTAVTWAVDATDANTPSKVVARNVSGDFSANVVNTSRLTSNVAIGTAPFTVVSTTKVDNLNVDQLDGMTSADFAYREEVEALLGDLLYVGNYDVEDDTEESFATFFGLPNNYITVSHAANPSDASYDIRQEITVPPLPTSTTIQPRSLSIPAYITWTSTGNVMAQMNGQDASVPSVSATAATLTGQGFPTVGQRVQIRFSWDAATDTLALLWRLPGTDLLNDTGWTMAASGVQAGKAMVSGGTSMRIGGSSIDRFEGSVYRTTRKVNGVLDIDVRFTEDFDINNPVSFVSTSGHTVTPNYGRRVEYVTFPGTAGNYLSTPDIAALDILGDICIVAKVKIPVLASSAAHTIVSKRQTNTNGSYRLDITSGNAARIIWTPDGTDTNQIVVTSTAGAIVENEDSWIAVTLDVNNGASGRSVRFWKSIDGISWTEHGTVQTTAGVTSIFNSTSVLEIGSTTLGTQNFLVGHVYHVSIRNSIGASNTVGGTEVFRLDRGSTVNATTTTISTTYNHTFTVNKTGGSPTTVTFGTNKTSMRLRSVLGSKPHPDWGGGPDIYRHAMYWVASSTGTVGWIDQDLSGRYEVEADGTVEVYNQDWIIALDPEVGTVGHELGTDQPYSQMIFQWIPNSAETYIKALFTLHRAEIDPHPEAGYLKSSAAALTYATLGHSHDVDIMAAILLHEGAEDPHTQYLTNAEGNLLYLPIDANFDTDILEFIAWHEAKVDPHPQYLNNAEADLRYDPLGSVTTHEAKADPHPQYLNQSEGDIRYEATGAVAAHEARPDPHPQYQTTSEGDARYAPAIHDHNAIYFSKTEIVSMFGDLEEDVKSTDGAQSSVLWVGSEKPSNPGIGDILIRTPNIALQPPGIVPAFVASSTSPFSIELDWNPWPAGASVTTIDLEWSANGTTGWAAVTGSPLDDLIVEYIDTVAAENTTRYYRIRANNATGPGAWSSVLMGRSQNDVPLAPSGLTIGTKTPNVIPMTWTAPVWTDPGLPAARYEMIRNGGVVGFASGGNVTNKALTSNVATLTTSAAHGLTVGDTVIVEGVDATFNGTYVVATVPLTTTFTYAKTAANVTSAAATGTWASHTYRFTGLVENTAYTLGVRAKDGGGLVSTTTTIGPNATTTTTNGAPVELVTGITVSASSVMPEVTVSWTNPTLPVDFSYLEIQVIRSSDSAVLATSTGNSTTVTKLFAEVTWGTVVRGRVRVVDQGGLQGPWVTTAGTATVMAEPITGTPAISVNKTDITVTWTAPAVLPTDFTGYRLYEYQGPSGTTALSNIPKASALTHTFDDLAYATQRRYRVTVERSGAQVPTFSAYSANATAISDPIPTGLNLAVTSLNTLTATWNAPAAGEPDDSTVYRVRLKNSGGSILSESTVAYNATQSVQWTNQSYSTTYYFDVRLERSNGQNSSYATQVSATTGASPDTTPPAAINNLDTRPYNNYGEMHTTFNVQGDCASYAVWREVNYSGTWEAIVGQTATAGGAGKSHYIGNYGAGTAIRSIVRQWDALGNASDTGSNWYTLLASPYQIAADSANAWRNEGGGRYGAGGLYAYQDYYSTASYNYRGMIYYGTKIQDQLSNPRRTITNCRLYLVRASAGGSTASPPTAWLYLHGQTTNPGVVYTGTDPAGDFTHGPMTGPSLRHPDWNDGSNAGWSPYLGQTVAQALVSGSRRGFATYDTTPHGQSWYQKYENPATNSSSGVVEFTHLG